MTYGQYNGVPEGKFKVTVEKMKGNPNWNPKTEAGQKRGEILKSVVNAFFGDVTITILECGIVKGMPPFDFDVKPAMNVSHN